MIFTWKIMLVLQKSHVESVLTVPISPTDLYCTLEVDSFGYFVNKAKTRVYRDTTEPNWNEVRLCFLLSSKFCLGPLATTRPDTLKNLNLGGSLRLPWLFLESAGGRSDVSKRFLLLFSWSPYTPPLPSTPNPKKQPILLEKCSEKELKRDFCPAFVIAQVFTW